MSDLPKTTVTWAYHLTEKLGFPIALIFLAWFRLLEPAVEKHFDTLEHEKKARDAVAQAAAVQTDILKSQTELLSQIRSSQSEEVIRNREAVQLLREIKQRDGGM